jgi:diadenosine tetraphosphate (Ap4A) HIT family hydrolase
VAPAHNGQIPLGGPDRRKVGAPVTHADDCVFCQIVRGQLPASYVHADEDVVAFMDLRPMTPGHLLVVPRTHATGLMELDEADGVRMWFVAHRLGRALRHTKLRCDGVNIFVTDGAAAGQEVFHTHLHVVPRFPGDGVRIEADRRTGERAELDSTGAAVRAGLRRLAVSESD